MSSNAITLQQLNNHIANLLSVESTRNVWVMAELSDVSIRGGHCYMELLQKDQATGNTIAKARAAIWANVFVKIRTDFYLTTGQDFQSGIKVMVRASVSMHPVYGLSLVITAVNPEYTMGDLIRRRNEMISRLKSEGIYDMNRSICLDSPPMRIAVISSSEAAGYEDFMNQLRNNTQRLKFHTKLFPAIMQGERVAASVMDALKAVESEQSLWDVVVIIRGGGATSDLLGFENYELAACVAQFPLPVIVGIGHERDVTILDYVAGIRVKTPTAAAEWLIERGAQALNQLSEIGTTIVHTVRERLSGCRVQLGQLDSLMNVTPQACIDRSTARIDRLATALHAHTSQRLAAQLSRLDTFQQSILLMSQNVLERRLANLETMKQLLEALSPQATLRRGYSITRYNGHAVTSVEEITDGAIITTTLANGVVTSSTLKISKNKQL